MALLLCVTIVLVVHANAVQTPTQFPVMCTYLPFNNITNINASTTPWPRNITDSIEYIQLGSNFTTFAGHNTAELYEQKLTCDNHNGCVIECLDTAACFNANVTCNSHIGCNIICRENLACGAMKILEPKISNTSINLVCYAGACQDMKISIAEITSFQIHCLQSEACARMTVVLSNISSVWNMNTSINCYAYEACQSLQIITDGPLTSLNMYEYSSNVVLNNSVGYIPEFATVNCGIDNYFVEFPFDRNQNIDELVRAEYYNYSNKLPCDDVIIYCLDMDGMNGACQMTYEYLLDSQSIEQLQDDNTGNYTCVNFALNDILDVSCVGKCISSPTMPPTNAPSSSPSEWTNIPTFNPSVALHSALSHSPTQGLTNEPSQSLTYSSSEPPTQEPSYPPILSGSAQLVSILLSRICTVLFLLTCM